MKFSGKIQTFVFTTLLLSFYSIKLKKLLLTSFSYLVIPFSSNILPLIFALFFSQIKKYIFVFNHLKRGTKFDKSMKNGGKCLGQFPVARRTLVPLNRKMKKYKWKIIWDTWQPKSCWSRSEVGEHTETRFLGSSRTNPVRKPSSSSSTVSPLTLRTALWAQKAKNSFRLFNFDTCCKKTQRFN